MSSTEHETNEHAGAAEQPKGSAAEDGRKATGGSEGWLTRPERGVLLGIHGVFWLATAIGRWPARQLVRLVALYYMLFDRGVREASRSWLKRVAAAPSAPTAQEPTAPTAQEPTAPTAQEPTAPSWRDIYRHVSTFAQVTLDRVFLLQDKTSRFRVRRTGHHYLEALRRSQTGAVLLGAHLGSFEAMRAGATEDELSLNIVGHFDNARMVNSLFDRLNPALRARVIDVGHDPIGTTLRIKERVEAGEMVALLGDRTGLNEKFVTVDFFGDEARFPTGPFLLASMLKCPVYLVFGLYYEPNRYELYCEPFADEIVLPRGSRQQALQSVVQAYARRLEEYARKAPYNWFNFFDFWNEHDA